MTKNVFSLEEIAKDGWKILVRMDKQYLLIAKDNARRLMRTYEAGNRYYSIDYEYKVQGRRTKASI